MSNRLKSSYQDNTKKPYKEEIMEYYVINKLVNAKVYTLNIKGT